jgi:antitoxin PrlF
MIATITSKGQITLPKDIRKRFHLNKGDRVEFIVDKNRNIKLVPHKMSIKELKNSVPKADKIISIDEMNEAIKRGAAEK